MRLPMKHPPHLRAVERSRRTDNSASTRFGEPNLQCDYPRRNAPPFETHCLYMPTRASMMLSVATIAQSEVVLDLQGEGASSGETR